MYFVSQLNELLHSSSRYLSVWINSGKKEMEGGNTRVNVSKQDKPMKLMRMG